MKSRILVGILAFLTALTVYGGVTLPPVPNPQPVIQGGTGAQDSLTARGNLLVSPFPAPVSYNNIGMVFGDSYHAATCGGSIVLTSCLTPVLAAAENFSTASTNYAVSGSQVNDVGTQLYAVSIPATANVVTEVGVNDSRFDTTLALQNVFRSAILAEYAYMAIPNSQKTIAGSSNLTYTGTWNSVQLWAGGLWQTKECTSVGCTISGTQYGSVLYVPYVANGGPSAPNNATWNITVDGIVYGPYSANPGTNITSLNGLAYAPQGIRIPGLSEGPHNWTITGLTIPDGNSFVPFDWIGGNYGATSLSGPKVVVGNVPHRNSASYSTYGGSDASVSALNQAIRNTVAQLNSDGLYITLADWAGGWNISTMLGPDNLHPNVAGYAYLAATDEAQFPSQNINAKSITQQTNSGSYSIRSGFMFSQGFALNNEFICENTFFSSASAAYVLATTGFSQCLYFNGGSVELQVAVAGTGGTTPARTVSVRCNSTGVCGMGGVQAASAASVVTGFQIFTDTSGVFHILSGSVDLGSSNIPLISGTAPTVGSGFGTGASITKNNGTAAFTVNVGTGGTASSGVITMPAATDGWACSATDITTTSTSVSVTKSVPTSITSITLTNYTDVSVAGPWAASDVLVVTCSGY